MIQVAISPSAQASIPIVIHVDRICGMCRCNDDYPASTLAPSNDPVVSGAISDAILLV